MYAQQSVQLNCNLMAVLKLLAKEVVFCEGLTVRAALPWVPCLGA